MADSDQSGHEGGHGLDWREGGVPVSRRFDDPFFSLAGGLEETSYVFHHGNDLDLRLRDGFRIAETGFGTGLNLLATALLWQGLDRPGHLSFTSFEAYPLSAPEMATAHLAFPALAGLAAELQAHWSQGARQFTLGRIAVTVVEGDVRQTLPQWPGRADAWFLDGFSPAKNPEMWADDLMAEIGRHTAPGGSFATYTAAGPVRRALAAAGFDVQRVQGFGRKRHMTKGVRP